MAIANRRIAARCLADAAYAGRVLREQRYPEVCAAILADIAAAPEVLGYVLAVDGSAQGQGEAASAAGWLALPHPALSALAAERSGRRSE